MSLTNLVFSTSLIWDKIHAFVYVSPDSTMINYLLIVFRGKQTCLDIQGPRFLGKGITRGTIYISIGTGYMTELMLLQGNDGISSEFRDDDKENRLVVH